MVYTDTILRLILIFTKNLLLLSAQASGESIFVHFDPELIELELLAPLFINSDRLCMTTSTLTG
jgi:hypothetical protein